MTSQIHESYFQQAQSCFFRWEEDGRVLVWDNGQTIAFRVEIAAVMKRLAEDRLPPFNAIVLLLAGCRANWGQAREVFTSLIGDPEQPGQEGRISSLSEYQQTRFHRLIRLLDQIQLLPADLRSSVTARSELLACIFETAKDFKAWPSVEQSPQLCSQLAAGIPANLESQGGISDPVWIAVNGDQRAAELQKLLATFDGVFLNPSGFKPDALRRRIKTGLEQEVLPANDPSAEKPDSLIGQLLNDNEHSGLARLARDLKSLLTFPRKLSQPDDVAMGGVSDLTNRGQLDRLLLSELAHDDLTLASRIALNEALYLHRETPPSQKVTQRQVFVDTGLCMWGVPRLFATAVALAMNESVDERDDVTFWTWNSIQLVPVTLSDREGLEAFLGRLDADLTPQAAIQPFLDTDQQDTELVIVTDHDVVQDSDFMAVVKACLPENVDVFLVEIDRDGNLRFCRVSSYGLKVIRTAKLDLETILSPPRKTSKSVVDSDLPILFSQKLFPLRLFSEPLLGRSFRSSDGYVSGTGDGQLLLWDSEARGGRVLTEKLGKGRLLWFGLDEQKAPMFVWGTLKGQALKVCRMTSDLDVTMMALEIADSPVRISGYQGEIFVEFKDRWGLFEPNRSQAVDWRLKEGNLPTVTNAALQTPLSAAARFWKYNHKDHTQWLALSSVSGKLKLETLPIGNPTTVDQVFDSAMFGIVLLRKNRTLESLDGEALGRSINPIEAISIDGNTIAYRDARSTTKLKSWKLDGRTQALLDLGDSDPFRGTSAQLMTRTPRKKFRGISIEAGNIVLRTAKGVWVQLDVGMPKQQGMVLKNLPVTFESAEAIRFEAMKSPEGCVYTLEQAVWECGSRAVLDSRGLLHLMSHNSLVPQISLVLDEKRIAGWAEDLGVFGDAYYHLDGGGTPFSVDHDIYQSHVQEFIRCVNSN